MSYEGPGIYQHYKGNLYCMLGLALSEETVHKPGEPKPHVPEEKRVIYMPLEKGSILEEKTDVGMWSRKLWDFESEVEVGAGVWVPRFACVNTLIRVGKALA